MNIKQERIGRPVLSIPIIRKYVVPAILRGEDIPEILFEATVGEITEEDLKWAEEIIAKYDLQA